MYPVLPRVFAGVLALGAAAAIVVLQPLSLLASGHPVTAQVMAATAVPLVLLLAWMCASPATLQRALARVSRVDLRDGGQAAALLMLAVTLYYVVGFNSLVAGALAYEVPANDPTGTMDEGLLVGSLVVNLVVLVLPVAFYVSAVHGLGPAATARALGLRAEGAPRAVAMGVVAAVASILLLALVSVALQTGGVELPENRTALAIAKSVSLGGALAIATLAALSEEVFFRGFLQPRVGMLGQAVLFSLAHLSYANAMQTAVTFVLALAFGLLYRRTGNLWAPIAAHFAFNLLMLLAGMYAT